MTETRRILIDSNIVIDIAGVPGEWTEWSKEQIAIHAGALRISPVIYAELCSPWESVTELENLLAYLGITYLEIPKKALFLAAQAFKQYRQLGGTKTSPLPDFFIGAHAAALGIPILTRDVSRYRTYFPSIELICP